MEKLEKVTEMIECVHSQLNDTKSLCCVIYEKIDHANGAKCLMTPAEYDTLRDLTSILFERIYDETMDLKAIIEKIYEEDKKENGKV